MTLSTPTPTDDPVTGLVGFTAVLRGAGRARSPPTGSPRSSPRSTRWTSRAGWQTYWAGRLTLCADPDDLPDTTGLRGVVRRARRAAAPRSPTTRPPPPKPAALTRGRRGGGRAASERPQPTIRAPGQRHRGAAQPRLADLTAGRARAPAPAARPAATRAAVAASRRLRPSRHGGDRRPATLRAHRCATRASCAQLRRRDHSRRPRKVVLLVDVSGLDGALRRRAAAVRARRGAPLARVRSRPSPSAPGSPGSPGSCGCATPNARSPRRPRRSPTGRAAPGWARCCGAFIDRWGQRGAARRAVVVVFSDGWERGEPDLLGPADGQAATARPPGGVGEPARGQGGLRARQGGIVAALPYLDDLLAGHSLATLEQLLEVVRHA